MARSALLHGKPRPRPRRFASPGSILFTGSLALTESSNTAALNAAEKFIASLGDTQAAASVSLTGAEKFSNSLSLTAPANMVFIYATGPVTAHVPGDVVIGDAAVGGLLALADAVLYRVHITESI